MAIYLAMPTIDSYMNGEASSTNYGAATAIEMGVYYANSKTKRDHAIGNFDVSALSGRTINSAQLERWINGSSGSGAAAKIFRCTRPSTWTEDGVTWATYDGTNAWSAGGGDYDTNTPTPVAFTEWTSGDPSDPFVITGMKGFVDDALNNRSGIVSIIMLLDDENPGSSHWSSWASKEGHQVANDRRWRLRIDHSGDPIGIQASERRFIRGAERGVLRGTAHG